MFPRSILAIAGLYQSAGSGDQVERMCTT
jgi:hypothetical protein